jgi:NADPH2:quinone reductase
MTKAKRVEITATGGPEVMRIVEVELAAPADGEVQVRHTAIGLNFIDTYHRSGLYPVPLPSGLGLEAAGVVEAVGQGVTRLKRGDRVAYGTGPLGAYATARNMPARFVVKLPNEIADSTAAAMMLKGMTVRYLLQETYPVKAGETILLHAAAGGVGLIASQWAKALGARVIGTVGSDSKKAIATAHGCDHVINSSTEDIAAEVKKLTNGEGVPVVYDGVGKATFMASIDCLKPRGLMVSFGNASGPVDSFNLGLLASKGSLYVTRPTLMTYTATEAELQANAADVASMVASGKVKVPVNQTYPLSEVVRAHHELASRATTGTSVFDPER